MSPLHPTAAASQAPRESVLKCVDGGSVTPPPESEIPFHCSVSSSHSLHIICPLPALLGVRKDKIVNYKNNPEHFDPLKFFVETTQTKQNKYIVLILQPSNIYEDPLELDASLKASPAHSSRWGISEI